MSDHDWNDKSKGMLWLYNLHYQDGLLAPETATSLKEHFIDRWMLENPKSRSVGWEAYPLSLRIVNWIKWSLSGGQLGNRHLQSLREQINALTGILEFHLLGNHLFSNAKALLFGGLCVASRNSPKWLNRGMKILGRQIAEQFLDDGGHFELSTTYHALLTEDLLDILQLCRAYAHPYPKEWDRVAERAVSWLAVMTRPDGLPPLFNDAAVGVAPLYSELVGYGSRMGIRAPESVVQGLSELPASGYFRFEEKDYSLFIDAGEIGPGYLPGHAHCDLLSFELFAHGAPVIVDTGVSTYQQSDRRQIERSTASHNTVQLGALEQSEIWGAFRVGRRARVLSRSIGPNELEASHSGYEKEGVTHARKFRCSVSRIVIEDQLNSNRHREVCGVARLHIHPDFNPEADGSSVAIDGMRIVFSGADRLNIGKYLYAPEFNVRVSGFVVEVAFTNDLTTCIEL